MANVLKMAIIEAIHSLRSAGLSCRAIARRLGIHRETVARHVRLGREGDSKPANATISPAGSDEVAGFGAPTGNLPVALESGAAPLICLSEVWCCMGSCPWRRAPPIPSPSRG